MPILQMVGDGILLSFVQAIKALMSMSKSAFLEAMKSKVLNTLTTTSTCDRYGWYTGIFLCWYMFTLCTITLVQCCWYTLIFGTLIKRLKWL